NETTQPSVSHEKDKWFGSFDLKDLGDNKTEFTLIHGGWKHPDEILPKANAKSSIIRDRMSGGWVAIVNEKLKKVVEG
ncbi:SRPBCC family protein, partial [Bacillus sp. SS-TM]